METVQGILEETLQKWNDRGPLIKLRPMTDLGNAEYFVDQNVHLIRYVPAFRKWLIWNGHYWGTDDRNAVGYLAKTAVRGMQATIALAAVDSERKQRLEWAAKCETQGRVEAMIHLSESDPRIVVRPEDLDANPFELATLSGIVDLRTGAIREADPSNLITRCTGVPVGDSGNVVRFMDFLNDITCGNFRLAAYIQRWAGYMLTGSTREQALLVCHGTGANGKSTLWALDQKILGSYSSAVSIDTFLAKRGGGIPADIAALRGLRAAFTSESDDGRRLAESTIKLLTGGDPVQARHLYGDFFSFIPTAKIIMSTNHRPRVRGTDYAIWRRIRLLPFAWTCPPEKRNPDLVEELFTEEGPAILAWMIEGCVQWVKNGLQDPDEVKIATDDYRSSEDVFSRFIAERTEQGPLFSASFGDLYGAYKRWCEENGERYSSARSFSAAVEGLPGIHKRRVQEGMKIEGMRLPA